MNMIKQYRLKDYNFRLILWVLILSIIGILLVTSAMDSLSRRQIAGVIAGVVLMLIVSFVDFSWILNFNWIFYGLNIVMLLAVRLFGDESGGATRWLDLKIIRFQPTELSKLIMILFFARYFMDHEEDLNSFKTIIKSLALFALPAALIFFQPDLKNTITIVVVFCAMFFLAGLSLKIIFGTVLALIPIGALVFFLATQTNLNFIRGYQAERITSFFNQDDSENSDSMQQQNNSIIAIGSGQLTGKGLNNDVSSANKGNFISQIQTDFIFAVAGEEMGFLGCFVIIALIFLICTECIIMGRRSKDLSGQLICSGLAVLIGFQSFINIGVATKILPNTGTPLPFVSYGLSSLLSLFIGIGFVLNIGLQRSLSSRGEFEQYEKARA